MPDAVSKHLATFPDKVSADDLIVVVDITAYNSKRYYVITEAPNKAQQVSTFPLTGTETVLDGIASADSLADVAGKSRVRVVRKRVDGTEESLPVDWKAIIQSGDVTTNYQLQSGDRLYVTRK